MEIIDIHVSLKSAIDDAIARAVAIGGLVVIALIHMLQLPAAFASIGYLGALFIAAVIACLGISAVMTRTSDDRAWIAACALPALILLGYLISRSVGLPGFTDDIGEWSEPLGLASMVAEGLMVFVGGSVLASRVHMTRGTAAAPAMRPGPAVG